MIGNITMIGPREELYALFNARQNSCIQKPVKVVTIDDENNIKDTSSIIGSILLPSTQAMLYLIDGGGIDFVNQYCSDIVNDVRVKKYIDTIVAAVVDKGTDIVMYFNNNDNAIWQPIAYALSLYLNKAYGIVCYTFNDYVVNPQTFMRSSLPDPSSIAVVHNMLKQQGMSSKPDGLFVQY